MKNKFRVAVLCSAAMLLTGAVALTTVDKLFIDPVTVDSTGGLIERYLSFRTQWGPIVPPSVMYEDVADRMSAGDWSFLNKYWFSTFDDGVLYVPEKSALAEGLKLPARIQVREDLKNGLIYILSAPLTDGKSGNFTGLAAISSPAFMTYEKDFPLDRYLFDEFSPRRVIWEVTLKSEADAWSDLLFQQDESASSKLLGGGGMMRMMVPEEFTNTLWLGLEPQSGGLDLNVFAPEDFTNRVEIYSCTDLISNVWEIAVQDLYPFGTNPAVWSTGSETVQFYRAGNMDADYDLDGLPDAREVYVYGTDPFNEHSDNDGMPDGWEVMYGLNPLVNDAEGNPDGDGLSNIDEYNAGKNPRISDTLTSGAAGTLSYQYDEDGRITQAHLNGAAAIWYQNSPAHNLKTLDIYTN